MVKFEDSPTRDEKIQSYTVKGLADYIHRIELIRNRDVLFFRGLSNKNFDLSPSLSRPMSEGNRKNWTVQESQLVEYAEQRFPESFIKPTPALLIANMQHYGIPTRMMDITGNALVALYFACQDTEVDGEVVVFDGKSVSAHNPFANIIADTYRLTNNAQMNIDLYRYLALNQDYASTLRYPDWDIGKSALFWDQYLSILKKPLIIDVGYLNQRQINQNGKFIIFPNVFCVDANKKTIITKDLVKMNKNTKPVKALISISKDIKTDILKKLRLVGISDSFIFPDDKRKVIDEIKQNLVK